MTSKIEEIVHNIAVDFYCDENGSLSDELERWQQEIEAMTADMVKGAAAILKEAEAKSFKNYITEDIQPRVVLLSDLQSLFTSPPGEQKENVGICSKCKYYNVYNGETVCHNCQAGEQK